MRSSMPHPPPSGGATGSTRSSGVSRSLATPTSGWRSGPTSGPAPESSTTCSSGTNSSPPSATRSSLRVTPLHVRSWYAEIAAQTPGSARSAYRLLKAIFNTAILDDLLVKNPCRVKGGGTDRVTDRRIPNVDQVAALTQSMPEQYRATVTLAAWGTLRRGEVLGLNRSDVDLRAGTVLGRALPARVLRRSPRARSDQERRVSQGLHAELGHAGARGRTCAASSGPRATLPSSSVRRDGACAPATSGSSGRPHAGGSDLKWVRFHDLRHFAATMFASTGASTKEIMSRGGWKSVAMVVRYEHASEERDAFLAQALNQFAEPSNVVSITNASPGDRARSAHDDLETEGDEGEVFDLDPLIRENEEECSGGETRTHNLAVNSRLLCH